MDYHFATFLRAQGIDPKGKEAAETAYLAVIRQGVAERIAALRIVGAPKGDLAQVASSHGCGLPNRLPEGITPDSLVYQVSGGTNGKRPTYCVVGQGGARAIARGTFFGRQSSFNFVSDPEPESLMGVAEVSRLRYAAGQAALAALESPTDGGEIINLTPHEISLANEAGAIIKTIPAAGTIARVSTAQVDAGFFVSGLPVVRNQAGEVDGLPKPEPGKILLVSLFVLSAVTGRQDVIAPDTGPTCVRDEKGRILAVRQFLAA